MLLKSILQICCIIACYQNSIVAESFIELRTSAGSASGTPIFHNKQICWLAEEDGSYSRVLFRDVTSSRRLKKNFHPFTSLQAKTDLQRELGKSFEVITAGQFVVAAPQGKASSYARMLDVVSRSFSQYSSVRRLPVKGITYPLVVIIYPNQLEFSIAARERGISADRTLKGFYHPWTNKILMFEEQGHSEEASANKSASEATISTLIHEGIHQLAFNQGLHSRVGRNPRWVVEGLANMMEVNIDVHRSQKFTGSRINVERLSWFKNYLSKSRKEAIAEFIVEDEAYFRVNPLNANSQAWALTFYLAEEHPSAYAKYLKTVAERDPLLAEYSAKERIIDFQKAFGNDLAWLEVRFLRYIDRLSTEG